MSQQAASLTPFGLKCREYRIRFGRSIGDQADHFSVAPSEVSSIETGLVTPSNDYILRFCDWLKLDRLDAALLQKMTCYTDETILQFPLPKEHREARKLFRKVNKLSPAQIRDLGRDDKQEVCSDRRVNR